MTYTEKCACGASVTISGWALRDVDLSAWWQRHAACGHKTRTPVRTAASCR